MCLSYFFCFVGFKRSVFVKLFLNLVAAYYNYDMEQIDRIKYMEGVFEETLSQTRSLMELITNYDSIRDSINELSAYYSGKKWKQDFAADEASLLPPDLKRGVLSEDGIWNLLCEWREIEKQIVDIAHRIEE